MVDRHYREKIKETLKLKFDDIQSESKMLFMTELLNRTKDNLKKINSYIDSFEVL